MHDPRWKFANKNETLGILNTSFQQQVFIYSRRIENNVRVAELNVSTYQSLKMSNFLYCNCLLFPSKPCFNLIPGSDAIDSQGLMRC